MEKNSYLYLQFAIAEKLGKTHKEIATTMTTEELYAWSAYLELKGEREEKAYEDARRKSQYKNVR